MHQQFGDFFFSHSKKNVSLCPVIYQFARLPGVLGFDGTILWKVLT